MEDDGRPHEEKFIDRYDCEEVCTRWSGEEIPDGYIVMGIDDVKRHSHYC